MSRIEFTKAETIGAVESITENPRAVCIRCAIGESCIAALMVAKDIKDMQVRRAITLELLGNELPELQEGLAALAMQLNAERQSTLRATDGLWSPVLYRKDTTPVHVDSFNYTPVVRPFLYGPISVSFGLRGVAVLRDYGPFVPNEGIDIDRLRFGAYAHELERILEHFAEYKSMFRYERIVQKAGDLVLLPAAPHAIVHEVARVSEDRCAVVSAQLWYDSDEFDRDSPASMQSLTERVHAFIKPVPAIN